MKITDCDKTKLHHQISLTDQEQILCMQAINVRSNAQAPYSRYAVGSAVLASNGQMYVGCNVERCTFTQSTHAEQNAIDTMIAMSGSTKIFAVAFAAAPIDTIIITPEQFFVDPDVHSAPCGHCLQIIWENCFGDGSVKIMAVMPNGMVGVTTIGQALPMRFGPGDVGVLAPRAQ